MIVSETLRLDLIADVNAILTITGTGARMMIYIGIVARHERVQILAANRGGSAVGSGKYSLDKTETDEGRMRGNLLEITGFHVVC